MPDSWRQLRLPRQVHNGVMPSSANVYQPGVCNIGPAEIRQRRLSGIVGAIVTALALVAFVVFQVATPWRVLVILPAAASATGFLQAAFHFCVRFGMAGLFNFGDQRGKQEAVHEQEYRKKDQRTALSIIVLAALAGIVVAIIAVLLP
jgi:hypothetical protein